jgi:hypothetical protein
VAAVELVLLLVIGGALLVDSTASDTRAPRPEKARVAQAVAAKPAATARPVAAAAAPALARADVRVLVLNGNGRTGAAAAAASRVQARGYRIAGVGNAPRTDFTRTLVMYRAGFAAEAKRLARDLRVQIVGPLDGMRPREVGGAHAVLVVGA